MAGSSVASANQQHSPRGIWPQGLMGVIDLSGIDCTASGICKDPDNWNDYVTAD